MSTKCRAKGERRSRTNESDWANVDVSRLNAVPCAMFVDEELAAMLRLSADGVINLIDDGALLAVNISNQHSKRHFRIPKAALIEYLKRKGIPQRP